MMNKKESGIEIRGILFGIIFMMLVVGVVCVNVGVVRGIVQTIAPNPPPPTDTQESPQITKGFAEKQLGGNVNLEGNTNGAKVNKEGGTLTSPSGGTTINGLNSAVDQTNVKINSDGSIDLSSEEFSQHVAPGQTYDFSTNQISGQSITPQSPTGEVTTYPQGTGPQDPSVKATGKATSSCGGSGGEGGGGGGSGAGGEKGKLGKEAMAAAQQALSLAAQVGGPIKEALKKQPNPPNIFIPTDDGTVAVTVDKGAIANIEDATKAVTLAQNDPNLPGDIKGTSLKDFETGNSVIIVYGSVDAILVTPPYKRTHVINDLARGNATLTNKPASEDIPGAVWFLPFIKSVSAEEGITGEAIIGSPNQEIKLKDYDLGISGENLLVAIFKPFDKVNAMGTNLDIIDGNVTINFKNMKTNYPRLVHINGYFINEIRNDYDDKNLFKMIPNGSKGNYFTDGRYRLTVGDAVVKNPLQGYENVKIPQTRYEMWKRAADGEYIS